MGTLEVVKLRSGISLCGLTSVVAPICTADEPETVTLTRLLFIEARAHILWCLCLDRSQHRTPLVQPLKLPLKRLLIGTRLRQIEDSAPELYTAQEIC